MDYVSNLDNHSALDQVLGWIVNFIYAFHMPLFFMLSGMCFYLSTKRKTILLPKLLKSKAIRLLLPFVFVSLLLSIPIKYCSGYWQGSDHIFYDIFMGQLLLMGNSHLWFVVSLFWIFLVSYYIVKINRHKVLVLVALILLSSIGWYVEPHTNFLGIPGAIKHLLFFILGYNCFSLLSNGICHNIKYPIVALIVVFFMQNAFLSLYYHHLEYKYLYLIYPICYIFLALLGSVSIVQISMIFSRFVGGVFIASLRIIPMNYIYTQTHLII